MNENRMELGVNEERIIQLPNRGAMGLRMMGQAADASVASVSRREVAAADLEEMQLRPGDAMPAVWAVKGLKAGTTRISFTERRPGGGAESDLPLKDYEVVVR